MNMTMRFLTFGLLLATAPLALAAQGAGAPAARPESGTAWYARLGAEAVYSTLFSGRNSEFFRLYDEALVPVANRLDPRGFRGTLRIAVSPRWTLRTGLAGQDRAIGSTTRVELPNDIVGQATQWTTWTWDVLGAEWQAVRIPLAGRRSAPDLRVMLGAGFGVVDYRLRQVGRFVDVSRRLAFSDDFRSSGRGTMVHAGAAVELSLIRHAAVRAEWRAQRGLASMNEDYAEFDRLDIGGHQLSAGLVLFPFGRLEHRP